jgi:hypothetical protein
MKQESFIYLSPKRAADLINRVDMVNRLSSPTQEPLTVELCSPILGQPQGTVRVKQNYSEPSDLTALEAAARYMQKRPNRPGGARDILNGGDSVVFNTLQRTPLHQ